MPKRIFLTRPILDEGLALLRECGATIEIGQPDPNTPIAPPDLLAGVRRADVLLCHLSDRVSREVLEANPALLGVATYAVGYDNIDIAAASALGIPVSNTPDVLTHATADLTWALLLAVARKIPEAHRFTAAGRFKIWNPVLFLGADVGPGGSGRGKTLGVVGFGRIGRAVARRAIGFEMDVLAHSPRSRAEIESTPGVRWASMEELVAKSDFLTLHAPLTPKTRHLIGEAELRAMKPTAYLINVARGPMVDEEALVRALKEGWIAGAALDVYEHEPLLAPGLADLPNVVLAPHIGSATRETRTAMAAIAARNALAHLNGERAPQAIDPGVYDTPAWKERRARA
ncbi:MAG: D-glycerate dehydrogenase [Candidatus Eisenbacteria bacterium]|nr:D-glycerate dehydrogenase [Candidatus Eisenbacteria bacterium]